MFLLNIDLLKPEVGLLVWTALVFVIVFFILKKFAWPAIINGLKERENAIADSLASAEKIKTEMAQMKSENEALLAKAREESSAMIKEAKLNADKMVAEAKDKAKAEYDRIVADAQNAITQQKNAALTEVKNQVGNLVIEVAEKVLRRELSNKPEQESYIKQLADDVKLN
ncbi:MAG: F0F1 ATP synthase subunit B [Flavihumibacter sp.]|nr:F0F1 ATP synthase subunit B [Flavihumibacter sp.]